MLTVTYVAVFVNKMEQNNYAVAACQFTWKNLACHGGHVLDNNSSYNLRPIYEQICSLDIAIHTIHQWQVKASKILLQISWNNTGICLCVYMKTHL